MTRSSHLSPGTISRDSLKLKKNNHLFFIPSFIFSTEISLKRQWGTSVCFFVKENYHGRGRFTSFCDPSAAALKTFSVNNDTEHFNSNLFVFLSRDRFRSLHGVLPLIWNEAFATEARTWSDLGKHLGETMLAQPIVARP